MTCGHISASGRGEWWWWMPRLSVIWALTQMCQMKMLRSLKFTCTLESYFLSVDHVCVYVIHCMHWHSGRMPSVKTPLETFVFTPSHIISNNENACLCWYNISSFLIQLHLHNNTTQQQRTIKPRNQWSCRTAVKINQGYEANICNILPCPMGCFLCQTHRINPSWQENPLLTSRLLRVLSVKEITFKYLKAITTDGLFFPTVKCKTEQSKRPAEQKLSL